VREPPSELVEPEPEPRPQTGSDSTDTTHLPSLGPHGEGWFLLQIVFMVAVLVAGYFFGAHLTGAPRFAVAVAGGALIVAGLALGFFGIKDLDRSASPLPRPRDSAVLIQDGVYRRLRHPIYAGLILLALGWSLLTASLVALLLTLILALVLDLKARREEVWLRERYPGYAAYAQHTKRFVPGVY
jgi:protein-S-isoprenylcysteine O-methyltransferase Ste14